MAAHEQAEKLTKLQVGGISALALTNKNFKIYLDESAKQFNQIYVSGGKRGLDVKLAVTDLVRINSRQQLQNRPSSVGFQSAKADFANVAAVLTAVFSSK